ncbi:GntR family transcriptional regulator [Streptomyces avicenniae]|uniref:GntR family transcriptional regulator n=1 Tax=Streptomyces avicenniae TaxID=500153 RepID=UPI00069CB823|nr:GntR family transcriptional regulator [Streptomyces avicenniae]
MTVRTVRYQRIADDLRQQIADGLLSPGDRLPSEQRLATQYGVGLPTVRQAIALLEGEGLVDKRHGRGTFIRVPRCRVQYRDDRHAWGAWEPTPEHVTLRTVRTLEADRRTAAFMAVPIAAPLVEHRYATSLPGNAPHIVVHAYVLPELLEGWRPDSTPDPWADGIRRQLIAQGVELDRISERVTARPPSAAEAQTMDIGGGVALLEITRTTTDTTGRVVTAALLLLTGDRTEAVYTRSTCRPKS